MCNFQFSRRTLLAILLLGCSFVVIPAAVNELRAADPTNRQLLPKGDLVTLEWDHPANVLSHPIILDIWKQASKSKELKHSLTAPNLDRFRSVVQLIEEVTGENWQTSFEKLTAGGVAASFQPGGEGGLSLVLNSESEAWLQKYVSALRKKILSRFPASQRSKIIVSATYRKIQYYRFGKATYAISGKRFLFAGTEKRLQNMIDRLLDSKPVSVSPSPGPSTSILRVQLDLKALRKTTGLKKTLKQPTADAGQIAILGGWMDLLRRGDQLNAELTFAKQSIDLLLDVPINGKATTQIPGFFANANSPKPAPLLKIPGTIYSASWYRDYRSLWSNRNQLLTKKTVTKLETGDRTLQQQLSVIGGKTKPSVLFSGLGTSFRLVVARQRHTDYRVVLQDRLPAAAVAIGLRNEAEFREQITPFLKGLGLILTFGEGKMLVHKSKHAGVDLRCFRSRDDRLAASRGNRIRFQFSPTVCITHGHFIVGSTTESVRQVIDEIHRQSQKPVASPLSSNGMVLTEQQFFSFTEAANALKDFRNPFTHRLTFNLGTSLKDAEQELNVLAATLSQLGTATVRVFSGKNRFQYRVRIHRARNSTTGAQND